MKKDRSHTNSWTSEKGHADKNENRSVWQELAESEELVIPIFVGNVRFTILWLPWPFC